MIEIPKIIKLITNNNLYFNFLTSSTVFISFYRMNIFCHHPIIKIFIILEKILELEMVYHRWLDNWIDDKKYSFVRDEIKRFVDEVKN